MKAFFGNIENRVLSRSKSHGYKYLKFSDEVETGSVIKLETEDDNLAVKVTGEQPVNGTYYTFLTKEFGVYGKDIKALVSVIFCDNDWMLVTLKEGTILINHEDQILQPAVGEDAYPPVYADEIVWINAETLLSYKNYMKDELQKGHWQDFEYTYTVAGGIKGGLQSTTIKHHETESIDLSLGYIDELRKKLEKREEAKSARNMLDMFSNQSSSGMQFDFEDEDEPYEEDSYEDDDADFSL